MALIQETANRVRKEIVDFISSNGHPEGWHLGVCDDDPIGWVSAHHPNVNMDPRIKGNWKYWDAESKENALAIHQSIKNEFNTQGEVPSGMDSWFTHLYAFLITPTTQQ